MHAAAAAAAAATLDMEAVQRSLAAAAWRQGDLGAHLQGVLEEDEEEEEQAGSQQQQDQHPWGGAPPGPGPLAQQSCLVKAVFGSYSHRGLMHDNEDRVSVTAWGHDSHPAGAVPKQTQHERSPVSAGAEPSTRRSSSPESNWSGPQLAATPREGDRSILELTNWGRAGGGLGYDWHLGDSPCAAGAAQSAATAAAAAAAAASETVYCFGQKCHLPPPVAAGVHLAVQARFAADAAAMNEAAASAAEAAIAGGAATAADAAESHVVVAAAIDAAIEHLVDGPPALSWSTPAAVAAEQQQQVKWGPLSVLRRRKPRQGEVVGTALSRCWEYPQQHPATKTDSTGTLTTAADGSSTLVGGGPSGSLLSSCPYLGVCTPQKPLEAAKRDGSSPSVLFLVCDGHDTHEASAFISKALPLLAFRRLPHQLPLLHPEQIHTAGRDLFSDLDTLMRFAAAEGPTLLPPVLLSPQLAS